MQNLFKKCAWHLLVLNPTPRSNNGLGPKTPRALGNQSWVLLLAPCLATSLARSSHEMMVVGTSRRVHQSAVAGMPRWRLALFAFCPRCRCSVPRPPSRFNLYSAITRNGQNTRQSGRHVKSKPRRATAERNGTILIPIVYNVVEKNRRFAI